MRNALFSPSSTRIATNDVTKCRKNLVLIEKTFGFVIKLPKIYLSFRGRNILNAVWRFCTYQKTSVIRELLRNIKDRNNCQKQRHF